MEKPSELADSLKPLIETGELSEDIASKILPHLEELDAANAKLYSRTKEAETENKTLKEQLASQQINKQAPNNTEPDVMERLGKIEGIEEKRQFGYQNNLSPEETDYIFSIAKGNGKNPSDMLSDPFVKGGLETIRKQKSVETATPRPSSRQPLVEGKTFNELKPEDKRKNWSKATGAE